MPTETILLVEDDAPVRQLFARALEGAGYRVHEARNGAEAIKVFERLGPEVDLLITDMRMPHLWGADVIAELRQRRHTLKVLCVSAYPPTECAECDKFLQKPFTNADFLAAVRELVTAS